MELGHDVASGRTVGHELALSRIVSAYELAQRNRIATGALLRSLLDASASAERDSSVDESTDESAGAPLDTLTDTPAAGRNLRLIGAGRSPGPSPTLGELYRQERRAEMVCAREMARAVSAHPAWPWLGQVRGIGPTLAARLLARLRIERASTPSSFWQYCGLGTVPGERHVCLTCGMVLVGPAGRSSPRHHADKLGARCHGPFQRDTSNPVRVAPRLPSRGQPRSFDVTARSLMHLVGTSFLRRRSPYRSVYDRHREHLQDRTPAWTPMHSHLSAMRVMEKLFLAHLWLVWADALALPTRRPFELTRRGRSGVDIPPSAMVG